MNAIDGSVREAESNRDSATLTDESAKRWVLRRLAEYMQTALGEADEKEPSGVSGLTLVRHTTQGTGETALYRPALILIVQGGKTTVIGEQRISYQAGDWLLCGVDMPVSSWHTQASPSRPFLACSLTLSREIFAELLAKASQDTDESRTLCREAFRSSAAELEFTAADRRAVQSGTASFRLCDSFLRILEALREPVPAVASGLAVRDLHARVLFGSAGTVLRHIHSPGSVEGRIEKAIRHLRASYTLPLKMRELAEDVFMSESSFTRNFKRLTTLTPLQYQKQLRLHEAKRLLLSGRYDAQQACFQVGYSSPQQFSREYKRLFGRPPKQDAKEAACSASANIRCANC